LGQAGRQPPEVSAVRCARSQRPCRDGISALVMEDVMEVMEVMEVMNGRWKCAGKTRLDASQQR
jgi:hypothetical protein